MTACQYTPRREMSGLILGRQAAPPRSLGFVARERPADASLITYAGDGHLITFAPTGTGKTSGPVICNSLIHPGQLVVIDIKGEVHAATAQARSHGTGSSCARPA